MSYAMKTAPNSLLPAKHVAILFEGSWFFTQYPGDRSRILAVCPYVNANDHICEVGVWDKPKDNLIGIGNEPGPKRIPEGGRTHVTFSKGHSGLEIKTPQQIFETAHKSYAFPYFESTIKSNELKYARNPKMRFVSIPIPVRLIPDGELVNARVYPPVPKNDGICASRGAALKSYVTFLFLYECKGTKGRDLWVGPEGGAQKHHTDGKTHNHIIFRVRSPSKKDENSCERDCAGEHAHLMNSFDGLRSMVYVPGGSNKNYYSDVGVYPTPGAIPEFCIQNTGLTWDELGVPQPGVHFGDLAACAGGTAAGGGHGGTLP